MENLTVFDYIKSLNEHKYIFVDPISRKNYDVYIVNKALSMNEDTVYWANMLNEFPNIDKKQHYDFLFGVISPKKRWGKWHKLAKDDPFVVDLANFYEVSLPKAREYLLMMKPSEIEELKQIISTKGEK